MLKKKRILLMDDETPLLHALREMLTIFGYEAECVEDGDSVLETYRGAMEENNPFDLVILDLNIPGGKGGRETIAELRKIDEKVRAIVCSGSTGDPAMSDPTSFGFRGKLVKPYRINELRDALANAFESY